MEGNTYCLGWVASKAAFVIFPVVEVHSPGGFFSEGSVPVFPERSLDCRCACSKAEGGGTVLGIRVQVLFTGIWLLNPEPLGTWSQ